MATTTDEVQADGWACANCAHVILTRRVNRTSGYASDADAYLQRMNAAGGPHAIADGWAFGRTDRCEDAPRGVRCDVCGGDGGFAIAVRRVAR